MVSEQNGGTSFFMKDFNHLIHSLLAIHSCIDKNDTALLQICVWKNTCGKKFKSDLLWLWSDLASVININSR